MNFVNMVWSPKAYTEAAFLAREAGMEMFSRLEWLTIKPKWIVDMGCGSGIMSAHLASRYSNASILSLDSSEEMLHFAKATDACRSYICADAYHLPLPDQSVDLIFANFLLPWCAEFASLLKEWRRVLSVEGLLLFNFLGPDTFGEWRDKLKLQDLPKLIDMHEIGDLLLQEGFVDPVLDVNHYSMAFKDQHHLLQELRASGLWLPSDNITLPDVDIQKEDLEMNFEVVYAHAFAPAIKREVSASADGVTRIPLSHLRRKLT